MSELTIHGRVEGPSIHLGESVVLELWVPTIGGHVVLSSTSAAVGQAYSFNIDRESLAELSQHRRDGVFVVATNGKGGAPGRLGVSKGVWIAELEDAGSVVENVGIAGREVHTSGCGCTECGQDHPGWPASWLSGARAAASSLPAWQRTVESVVDRLDRGDYASGLDDVLLTDLADRGIPFDGEDIDWGDAARQLRSQRGMDLFKQMLEAVVSRSLEDQ